MVTVAIVDGTDRAPVMLYGRDAWALCELHRAGERGCTPIDNPGPRWSGYVHKLRRQGFIIESIEERHGGPFAGRHVRYVLRSRIEIVATNNGRVAA